MKPVDGLPDPNGPLTSSISDQAIAEQTKKCRRQWVRAERLGRNVVATRSILPPNPRKLESIAFNTVQLQQHDIFSKELGSKVSESTVKSIKKAYLEELRKRPRTDDGGEPISALPVKKRGSKLLLGDDLDQKVQIYLRKVREGGGAVSARTVIAAARGIVLKYNPSMLAELGGPVDLNEYWAHSLLKRMKIVRRKATTSKGKHTVTNFTQLKKAFLDDIVEAVTMEDIPAELILDWDQTGIKLVPCSS